MPRYFFDVRYDDEPWSHDQDGVTLVDQNEARAEARELVGALTKEQVRSHWRIAIRVREGEGEPFVEVESSG
jgi:hypothetical protein